ncbi:MAG: TonB-dependent receptor [Ignavibacteria bacterium]|nr:TonB-dependent receptor [Ignavibacteria bacterium]
MLTIHRNKKGTSAEKTQSQVQIYGFFPFGALNGLYLGIGLLIGFFAAANPIFASESTIIPDSIKEVTTKVLIKEAKSRSNIVEYGKIASKRSYGSQIGDLFGAARLQSLSLIIPSIEVRDYGGPGSMNLFSIRGLGPMRSVIMLDGIPLASSQTGVFDMSALPILPGQSIDLDLGGSSSIMGSGAMSGMIELISPSILDTPFCALKGGAGSFGELSMSLHGGMSAGNTTLSAMANHFQFEGDFPISFQPTGNAPMMSVKRQNAGNVRQNVFARASHVFEESQISTSMWTSFVKGDRGVPGAVLTGNIESAEASFHEQDIMIAGTMHAPISANAQLRIRASYRTSESLFKDPYALYAGPGGADNDFLTQDIFSHAEVAYSPHHDMWFSSGLMFTFTDLQGELLQPFVKGNPRRISGALFTRLNSQWKGYIWDFGIRMDMFSDQLGPALSGHAIIMKELSDSLTISAKCTRDFRVPSFNELYYLNYGTQFLSPETSMGIDLGLTYTSGNVTGQISIYHMSVSDQILAIPISPVQWSARNIGRVLSSGIESSFGYHIPIINIDMQLSYAYKHVVDGRLDSPTYNTVLPYAPRHTISMSMLYSGPMQSVGFIVSSIGERFGLIGELPDSKLKPVMLINPFFEYRIPLHIGMMNMRAEIRNLLNSNYQMILNFPLPGRSFIVQCGFTL